MRRNRPRPHYGAPRDRREERFPPPARHYEGSRGRRETVPAPRNYYYGAPQFRRSRSRSPPSWTRDDRRPSRWERPTSRDRFDDERPGRDHHRMHPRDERHPRESYHGDDQEAPLHQQIQWGKQITGREATPETILTMFEREGHAFSARNLATSVHRSGKIGGRRIRSDRRLVPLAEVSTTDWCV